MNTASANCSIPVIRVYLYPIFDTMKGDNAIPRPSKMYPIGKVMNNDELVTEEF